MSSTTTTRRGSAGVGAAAVDGRPSDVGGIAVGVDRLGDEGRGEEGDGEGGGHRPRRIAGRAGGAGAGGATTRPRFRTAIPNRRRRPGPCRPGRMTTDSCAAISAYATGPVSTGLTAAARSAAAAGRRPRGRDAPGGHPRRPRPGDPNRSRRWQRSRAACNHATWGPVRMVVPMSRGAGPGRRGRDGGLGRLSPAHHLEVGRLGVSAASRVFQPSAAAEGRPSPAGPAREPDPR